MFIREKKNPRAVVSVQIIDKSRGTYRVVKTIGSGSDEATIESLYQKGQKWIAPYSGGQNIFEQYGRESEEK